MSTSGATSGRGVIDPLEIMLFHPVYYLLLCIYTYSNNATPSTLSYFLVASLIGTTPVFMNIGLYNIIIPTICDVFNNIYMIV